MNYKKIKSFVFLLTIVLLNGCACFKHSPVFVPIPPEKRLVGLRQINNWTMTGAISVTYGKKRDIAHFKWAQKKQDYTINIFGPLNINGIRIEGSPDNVKLWRTDKKYFRAKTPEQLIQNQLGWQLPVSNIRYWVWALPVPKCKIDYTHFDQYGHLISLSQNGWWIKYSDFQSQVGKNIDLPKTIELKNKDLTIKLKITHYVII